MANTLLAALTGAAEGAEQGISKAMQNRALQQAAMQKRLQEEENRRFELSKLLQQYANQSELQRERLAGERENTMARMRGETLADFAAKGSPEAGSGLDALLGISEPTFARAAADEMDRLRKKQELDQAKENRELLSTTADVGYKKAQTAKAYADIARDKEKGALETAKLKKELSDLEGLSNKELVTLRGQIQDDLNKWATEAGIIDPKSRPDDYNRAVQSLEDAKRQRSAIDAKLGGPKLTPKKEGAYALANEAFKSARSRFVGREIKPEQLVRELNIYGVQFDPEHPERTIEGAKEYIAHRDAVKTMLNKFAKTDLRNIFKNQAGIEQAITGLISDNPDATPDELEAAIRAAIQTQVKLPSSIK